MLAVVPNYFAINQQLLLQLQQEDSEMDRLNFN
jgi:hypothetical protein